MPAFAGPTSRASDTAHPSPERRRLPDARRQRASGTGPRALARLSSGGCGLRPAASPCAGWPGISPAQSSQRSACFAPRRASVKSGASSRPFPRRLRVPQLSQTSTVFLAKVAPPRLQSGVSAGDRRWVVRILRERFAPREFVLRISSADRVPGDDAERRSSCSKATRPGRSCWRRRCAFSQPEVIGLELELPRFDLSLASRRATENGDRPRGGGRGPRRRARPEGRDDHAGGGRRRRLAEPDPARGDRRPGDRPHRPADSGRRPARRRPRADLGRADGGRRRLRRRGVARGRGRRRGRVSHRADRAADLPLGRGVRVPARRADAAPRSSAGRSTPSARSTRAC